MQQGKPIPLAVSSAFVAETTILYFQTEPMKVKTNIDDHLYWGVS